MDGGTVEPKAMRDLDDSDWLARIEDLGELEGSFEPLGAAHAALFADRGPVLLVSFETRASIRAQSDTQLPLGFTRAAAAGHSSLTLIAHDQSWFRDPVVYGYFDRLVDEAFFEDFDRVVFYGAGSCGYAAAAFSVAAPGATVVALAPQATLDARLTGWDDRFRAARRQSFTRRYGFAPDMLDGAAQGFVVFDPAQKLDAMHAALMARPQVSLLPCRGLGAEIETALAEMEILDPILTQACAGSLDAAGFWRLYRARRSAQRYLRSLAGQLENANRPWLEALVCRNAAARLGSPRFRNRLTILEEILAQQGRGLPRTGPDLRPEPRAEKV
jgi:hypothetical protein